MRDIHYGILKNYVVNETNQPEDKDKDEEKNRIDHPHEGLTEIYLPVSLILSPGLGDWGVLVALYQSMFVGLDDDVHEGFEETEDQPAVQQLDVGGVGQIGVDTEQQIFIKMISTDQVSSIFS